MSTALYPLAHGCDAELNAWCDANCPHFKTHGPLLARLDLSDHRGGPRLWRCYARHTLSVDGMHYVGGTDYCSRHEVLRRMLEKCNLKGTTTATVDVGGGARRISPLPPAAPGSPERYGLIRDPNTQRWRRPNVADDQTTPLSPPPPPPVKRGDLAWDWRTPSARRPMAAGFPHYEHDAEFHQLPAALQLPRLEDCAPELVADAEFWAASLYTSSYAAKAARLVTSCEAWGVCCRPALMPEGALEGVAGENKEGSYALRHRLIASKPIFILSVLRASPLPLVWLDVDLEFHSFPTLFAPAAWSDVAAPRDVLLWNWQCNVSSFGGRRLKMASGVAWFNKTAGAEALLLAWSEAMAYEPNIRAPDDQVMDLLVNDDGWIDRLAFGWLPESYLRMMPRHSAVVPVIDHDRGAAVSGKGKNSPIKPVLPPRVPKRE